MFAYNSDSRSFWFNSNSLENDSEFKLVGTIIGLAIYNAIILDVRFPLIAYKKLLGLKPTLDDVKDFDPVSICLFVCLISFFFFNKY